LKKTPIVPLPAIPAVIFSTVLLYQVDLVWGSKMNRVHDDAECIKKDPRFWFNQKMKLPPNMQDSYRKAMDSMNRELELLGESHLEEWAE
jgi:hypothetical protein